MSRINIIVRLIVDINRRADLDETVDPFGIGIGGIDTAVRHHVAEIVMPICPMDAVIARKPADPLNTWQIISRPLHLGDPALAIDIELAGGGGVSRDAR